MTTTTLPPIDYTDCRSVDDVNFRYQALFDAYDITSTTTPHYWDIAEGARRAYERFPADSEHRRSDPSPTPRVRSGLVIGVSRPTENEDGSVTITCTGPCGETKPIKKFPTMRSGGRGDVCRVCRDAAWAEARAARGTD